MLKKLFGMVREASGTSGHICCFCAREIANAELLSIGVSYKDGSGQSLFAHHDCLGSRLDPSIPFLSYAEWNEGAQ